MKYLLISVVVFLLATACSRDQFHRVSGGSFSVHFAQAGHEKIAERLAVFWKESDLLTGQKQDIGLFRESGSWEVRLISPDPESQINFNERKLLMDLQSKLESDVFENKPVRIVISNDRFEPVYDINE